MLEERGISPNHIVPNERDQIACMLASSSSNYICTKPAIGNNIREIKKMEKEKINYIQKAAPFCKRKRIWSKEKKMIEVPRKHTLEWFSLGMTSRF